jgi:anti-sigma regulatory factor (Ser/Thr protein kinase)
MEAARPAPDRWRLIASWLGVSVTTMLLAEELVSADEAASAGLAEAGFGRGGRDWDTVAAAMAGGFFAQARSLIDDGTRSGDISADQADELRFVLERVEQESDRVDTVGWAEAELRRVLAPNPEAAGRAREALAFIADGIPEPELESARLLVSELVTNSLVHAPRGPVELFIAVERNRLRVEVADSSPEPARPKAPTEEGGYGLSIVAAMASRWGADLQDGRNVSWFELDLPLPGRS